MSATATRREIRRAFGPQAIAVVQSTEAALLDLQGRHATLVQQCAKDSAALHTSLTEHDAALVHFKETLDAQYSFMNAVASGHTAFTHRTFWQRLRWLVRGR